MKPKKPGSRKPVKKRRFAPLARRVMWEKLDHIDLSMADAIKMFQSLKSADKRDKKVYGQMLRAMRQNFIGSFQAIKEDVALTPRETALANRIIKLLKNDYSEETLQTITGSMTCGFRLKNKNR